jgi:hypothetical protein
MFNLVYLEAFKMLKEHGINLKTISEQELENRLSLHPDLSKAVDIVRYYHSFVDLLIVYRRALSSGNSTIANKSEKILKEEYPNEFDEYCNSLNQKFE